MACCGSQRRQVMTAVQSPPVLFEYIGRATLRVVGPATGRTYWFAQSGARVSVDWRDAVAVGAVPHLRRHESR